MPGTLTPDLVQEFWSRAHATAPTEDLEDAIYLLTDASGHVWGAGRSARAAYLQGAHDLLLTWPDLDPRDRPAVPWGDLDALNSHTVLKVAFPDTDEGRKAALGLLSYVQVTHGALAELAAGLGLPAPHVVTIDDVAGGAL